jgi:hypothetical protein
MTLQEQKLFVFLNDEIEKKKTKDTDTIKRLMSSSKCRSVEVINNPARPGSNYKEINYINYK